MVRQRTSRNSGWFVNFYPGFILYRESSFCLLTFPTFIGTIYRMLFMAIIYYKQLNACVNYGLHSKLRKKWVVYIFIYIYNQYFIYFFQYNSHHKCYTIINILQPSRFTQRTFIVYFTNLSYTNNSFKVMLFNDSFKKILFLTKKKKWILKMFIKCLSLQFTNPIDFFDFFIPIDI